ncbi:FtsK/SpoIIIE domain-containing protein [Clostridium beijerinckii]|uniref:FtsK/SpoIIIE domain-containing protein n=1 Tax=Clostridium beijerinckii TaxID=1520 RepID=UPI001493E87C|nr:FtsK/SpoIIIE domain-containing protein [Clostridium beijerinckii]NOW07881.1 DNA replication protein DnaC [Clostridium beijerinckii]NYC05439.1 DNA replication protein DnaC [Clostridium beijerinckii]NYC05512.1 DNA replication protein DnaC [Clostridium beijerinckii]
MFVELGLAVGSVYLYNYLNAAEERKFKNNFNEVMLKTGIKNKEEETFKIYKVETKIYGYVCYLKNIKGLSVEHLESKINILECNLNSIIQIQKERFEDYIKMYVVNKDINKFEFEPVKCLSHLLCIGKDFKGQNYFVNLNKDPHILIGGATGTGKTFLLASILANLIYNSSKYIDLYLLQICKSEISAFENCECVKYTAYNEKMCNVALLKLIKEMDRRSEQFKKFGIRNITQWNKHKKEKFMRRIFVTIEELSFFMETDLWEYIMKIAKAGRSVGIHLITCIQRSTATNLPPDLKSQMTRITFRQKSVIDSTNIINTTDATKLKERECIIDGNSDYIMVKTPWIDEDYIVLHKYVPDIKIPSDEEKQEILNVKKINNKIYSIEQPKIVDVEESEIKEEKPKNNKPRKGVISLEDFNNANK